MKGEKIRPVSDIVDAGQIVPLAEQDVPLDGPCADSLEIGSDRYSDRIGVVGHISRLTPSRPGAGSICTEAIQRGRRVLAPGCAHISTAAFTKMIGRISITRRGWSENRFHIATSVT